MLEHQRKIYDEARSKQIVDMMRGDVPSASQLMDLANNFANARGIEKVQTVQRDANLEIQKIHSIDVPVGERYGYELAGNIQALIDFYIAATKAGVSLKFTKISAGRA